MVTMKDVAKACGVSLITVSRVINAPDCVAAETRARVEKAMADLGFLPNHTAKALAEKSTRTIHLYMPRSAVISEPFTMNTIAAVGEELSEAYYLFLIRRELEFNQRCDGMIVMGLSLDEEKEIAGKLPAPFVLFGKAQGDVDCVDVDNQKGAFTMMQHILSFGHKKIGFLMLDVNQRYAHERFAGYRQGLAAAGLPFDKRLVRHVAYSEQDSYEKACDLLSKEWPTAIFCCNDLIAIGVFRAAERYCLKIPGDLSVAGFDGLIFDHIPKVPLTTMRQPVYETGRRLARRLLDRLKDPELPLERTYIPPELIVRESVGPIQD